MKSLPRCSLLRLVPLAIALLALTGCVTSKKYRLAKDNTPPAQTLDWSAATSLAEVKLHSLIVFKGPGSWKREARWDEYVVQIANRAAAPLVIESAELVDVLGAPQLPGDDPWKLEARSKANWSKYSGAGLNIVLGAGAFLLYATAESAVALSSMMGGGAGAGAAGLALVPLIAVVDIAAVAVMNHNNKAKVQAEFDRRRLRLPLTLTPGATMAGSLFFPTTPGPQRLVIRGNSGGQPCEIVLALKPLAGLHLKKN